MRLEPAFEPLIQAYSGLISINGDPVGPPSRIGVSAVDLGTAMWCVIGCLAALRKRDATGEGQVVRTSLFETGVAWAAQRLNALLNAGMAPTREAASGHPGIVPYQLFDTADHPIFIAAGTNSLYVKLCTILGHPEWATDDRFTDNRARLKHRPELVGLIQGELRNRTRDDWLEALKAVGVPCSPLNTIADLLETEQLDAQELLRPVEGLPIRLVATPIWFDGERGPELRRAPELGEHDDMLGEP
jgi:formyl-CoA transferase